MLVLGIESSCDETAAAVLGDGTRLLSDVVNSQVNVHGRYGGVVPELASRKHLENIYPVIEEALDQAGIGLGEVDGLAVTQGPGLVGSLLVGLSFAKAISLVRKIPCVGVDHMAGHLLSVFLGERQPEFPYVALVASGGHSSIFRVDDPLSFRLLGRTQDDAAGEAFDKVGKLLSLDYPGGPAISRLAVGANRSAINFPRAWLEPGSFDFSFSGLKTAVATHVQRHRQQGGVVDSGDLCASFQEAVVEVLVEKTLRAATACGLDRVVITGGVAANPRLREYMAERGRQEKFDVFLPPVRFCTDNAAMIALAGYHLLLRGKSISSGSDAYSRSPFIQTRLMPLN
jgi:N6-L-threonylcarbamoyladenine synthase